jgi:homoserine kinase
MRPSDPLSDRMHIRLPATSANLGPCFDAAALALALHLEVRAQRAAEFSLHASGRDSEICGSLKKNLLIETYSEVLAAEGRAVVPLALEVVNGIPLGMGCGSSAAVRLAAIALAAHFGGLGWDGEKILGRACALEGHPDNAAACWLGGFVAATFEAERVHAISVKPPLSWSALLVLPHLPLATVSARAVLPEKYSREDVVANLQRSSLLATAFCQGRGDVLRVAMQDRVHQPYREEICPLLPLLTPLAGQKGILGVALSGAGPAILLLIENGAETEGRGLVEAATAGVAGLEVLACSLEAGGTAYL